MKALTFDGAVGLYYLTLAFFVPLAGFSETGRRRWVIAAVISTLYGYGLETVQILRGIDPRFTEEGTALDSILGGFFGLAAITYITVFVVLWLRFFQPPATLLRLSIRYAGASTMLAFAAGVGMTIAQGRGVGEAGNMLLMHALSFHALQAIPLLAWLLECADHDQAQSRRMVHIAGGAWFVMCAAVALHTAAGLAPDDPTLFTGRSVVHGFRLGCALRTGTSRLASRRQCVGGAGELTLPTSGVDYGRVPFSVFSRGAPLALKDNVGFGMSLPHRTLDKVDMKSVKNVAQRAKRWGSRTSG